MVRSRVLLLLHKTVGGCGIVWRNDYGNISRVKAAVLIIMNITYVSVYTASKITYTVSGGGYGLSHSISQYRRSSKYERYSSIFCDLSIVREKSKSPFSNKRERKRYAKPRNTGIQWGWRNGGAAAPTGARSASHSSSARQQPRRLSPG